MDEKERVKNVYSKFTIRDFWSWWSNNGSRVMEIRIKNKELIDDTAQRFNIPKSSSGVYVWDPDLLVSVIAYVREKATVWFGVNPRKKNVNRWGRKTYGGMDINVLEIGYIFIDIDRKFKDNKPAELQDLKNADELANKILDRLKKHGWNKSYIKICSGHGLQLLIKLDFPIVLPSLQFEKRRKYYYSKETDTFDALKTIIRKGIGTQIYKFAKKYEDILRVEIDKSGFNIGRVAALPCTKNFKYDMFKWRGIVELKDEINDGLSDYVMSKIDDLKLYKTNSPFIKGRAPIKENIIKPGQLQKHKVVRFMLDNDLPRGEINNLVWFQLKCILRDSKFDLRSNEFLDFHKDIEAKYKDKFPMNVPNIKYTFSENTLNNFCIKYGFLPLYELAKERTVYTPVNFKKDIIKMVDNIPGEYVIDGNTTWKEDVETFKKQLLKLTPTYYRESIGLFLKGCIKKYGKKYTNYLNDVVLDKYLNFDTKEV